MAKISKHSGPSYTEEEIADPTVNTDGYPRVVHSTPVKGDDDVSVGNSSETSPESTQTSSDKRTELHLPPALTTGNPSDQNQQEADSTAHTTGGSGRRTQPQPSAKGRRKPVDDSF